MKLKHLTMQAFGPFARVETINFEALGQESLFLIEGETGAGKTTILDAICFALYGEATSNSREAQNMRCDHSPDDLLTKVILEFSLGDTDYQIDRIPVQQRKKSVGEGTTEQKHSVSISAKRHGQEVAVSQLKGVKEKTDFIVEKMGFGVAQFRQIMVLPQGKFVDLLISDAKTRENIFAKLFDTHFYQKFADKLKEKAKEVNATYDNVNASIKSILKVAGVNTEFELADKMVDLSEQASLAKKQRAVAEANNKAQEKRVTVAEQALRNFVLMDNNQQELTALESEKEHVESAKTVLNTHEQAQKIAPLFDQSQKQRDIEASNKAALTQSQLRLKQDLEQLAKTQNQLNLAKQNALAVDAIKQEGNRLTSQLQDAELLTQAQQKLTSMENETNKAKARLDEQVKQEAQTKALFTQAQNQLENMNKSLGQIAPLQQQYNQQVQQRELLEKLSALNANLKEYTSQLSECETAQKKAFSGKETRQTFSMQTEMQWHANQAAILAKSLKLGEPCYVCGSTEHPNKATFDEGVDGIDKEQVEEARALAQQAIEAWDECKRRTQACQHNVGTLQTQISELTQTLNKDAELDLTRVKAAEAQTKSTLNSLESSLMEKPALEEKIEGLKIQASNLAMQVESAKELKIKADQNQVAASTEVEQLGKRLPIELRNIAVIQSKIESSKHKAQELESALAQAQVQFDKADKAVTQLESKIKQQNEQLTLEKTRLEKAQTQWLEALAASQFEAEKQVLEAVLSQDDQDRLKTNISKHAERLNSVQGKIAQLSELLKNIEKPDINTLNAKQKALAEVYQIADEHYNAIKEQLHICQTSTQELTVLQEQNRALIKEYGLVHKLSKIANGESGHKISFHRYVLSVLLDDVLSSASTRLNKMTEGRYALLRSTDKAKGNAASGLDLMVSDAHTGKQRPVSTMSGGESFMAALALALGLSDVVQSHAGGIKLDTLFIDEGFGSLDSEALEAAIEVLVELQASGRTIGIISHVPELKRRLDKRIEVRSGRSGSSLTVVTH